MKEKEVQKDRSVKSDPVNLTSYLIGFMSALFLTLLAYMMTVDHLLKGWSLIFAIMGLACLQLIVQLVFFLHLGKERGKRLDLAAFSFMLLVLFVLVGGSLWIMANLNYNMQMTPGQMDKYMQHQNTKGF